MNKFIFFGLLFFVLFLSGCSTQIHNSPFKVYNSSNTQNITNSSNTQNATNTSSIQNYHKLISKSISNIQNLNKSLSRYKLVTSNYSIIYLKLQPYKCQYMKWDIYYKNISHHQILNNKDITLNFKVALYYANVFNESSGKITKIQTNRVTCNACTITGNGGCITSYYYKMGIFKMNENFFLTHGWTFLNNTN